MSIGANETDIRYWTDYANPRDGICFRKEDAHTLVHEHYELERIKTENDRLREAFNETLARLSAANEAAGGGFMDARYSELLRELGIEVDD